VDLKTDIATGSRFGFYERHNLWTVWARTFELYSAKAVVDSNPSEWLDIVQHQNPWWPPPAIFYCTHHTVLRLLISHLVEKDAALHYLP